MQQQIKNLEKAMQEAGGEEQASEFVKYGKRILELVRKKDYDEARFTTTCFQNASLSFWRGPLTKVMDNYVIATIDLIKVLP